jgi:thiol-disulfide isomerase/thioredoxin
VNRLPSPSRRLLGVLVAAPFIIAACTTTASESTEPEPAESVAATEETAASAETEAAADAPQEEADETTTETAAWLDIELTDAASGDTFTLASLGGGVVAIEPMAIWCSNCKAQQNNVKSAYSDIADAGVTYISLGIDPGENAGALAKYAERNGFDWSFVKSPTELSRELSDLFGPQILSAPSTPLIVLDANGEVFTQEWGYHDPDALLAILNEAAAA